MPAAPAAPIPVPTPVLAAERPHTLTGDIRLHEDFHSRYLGPDRTIVVYLPPSYDHSAARHYPVLYLHDGQNVFDQATSFGDEWRVDETAESLIDAGRIEPIIAVGVYNAGEHRIDEYTPTARPDIGRGGHANDYGKMLVEELKPFIDSTYKTLPGAANTAMGGSSLGGLLTMHLGLRYPTAFGKLAVLSPSVWWDDRVLLTEVKALPHKLQQKIWLDSGTKEGPHVIDDARRLRDALVDQGWVIGRDLHYLEVEGGEHNELSWSLRLGNVLEFLFPPKT
ncbi:MAG: alpha/beta hydrolase-fold protein [Gemmatimonadaceae bacterium]